MNDENGESTTGVGGVSLAGLPYQLANYCTPSWLVIGLIVFLSAAGNFLLPKFNETTVELGFFFCGAIATQILLLATIAALGYRPWLQSVTVSLLGLLFVWASYIGGLRLMDFGMPVEVAFIMLGMALGGYLISYFFFRIMQTYLSVWICHRDVTLFRAASSRERPVSIRFLMMLTTAIAIAVCIIKWTLPSGSQDFAFSDLLTIAIQIVFFSLQSLVIFASLLWIILGKSIKPTTILAIVVSLILFPPIDSFVIQLLTRQLIYEVMHFAYLFLVGLTFFSAVYLGTLRYAGFELINNASKFDRSKYPSKFAPPADELMARWNRRTPSCNELESFFLTELCDSPAQEYFLANADIFFDAITRQRELDRGLSLSVLWKRLLVAAEFANTVDAELATHFRATLKKFARVYFYYVTNPTHANIPRPYLASIQRGALALNAACIGDLSLALTIRDQEEKDRFQAT